MSEIAKMTYDEYRNFLKSVEKLATDTFESIQTVSEDTWKNITSTTNNTYSYLKNLGIETQYDNNGNVIGYSRSSDSYTGVKGSEAGDYSNSNNLPSTTSNTRKINLPYEMKYEHDGNGNVNILGRVLPLAVTGGSFFIRPSGLEELTGRVISSKLFGTSVANSLGYDIAEGLYQHNPDIFGGINPHKIDYTDYYPMSIPLPGGFNVDLGKYFNLMMGTNPDTGESTMYLRDDDYAAIALKLWNLGLFTAEHKWEYPVKELKAGDLLTLPPNKTYTLLEVANLISSIIGVKVNYIPKLNGNLPASTTIKFAALTGQFITYDDPHMAWRSTLWGMQGQTGDGRYSTYRIGARYHSLGNPPNYYYVVDGYDNPNGGSRDAWGVYILVSYSEDYGYYLMAGGGDISSGHEFYYGYEKIRRDDGFNIIFNTLDAAYSAHYTNGVTKQPDSKLPDFSNINISGSTPIADTKQYIQNNLPDVYNNRLSIPVVQPDGTTKEIIYYPVPIPQLPDTNAETIGNLGPVSGDSKQTNTIVSPGLPEVPSIPVIVNPDLPDIDVGKGIVPPIILPHGGADALFTVYNPTLKEVQQFGAWMWSGNPIEQIKKLFYNPIDAIISLHKVYITPIADKDDTIHVGYLDSKVHSMLVTKQTNLFDFGTIALPEYFGNVFDYDPFTEVSIYLPFIGIVPLNVKDIMRSSMQVIYQCDMYTGNLMAQIHVYRDGNAGGILYTYPGNCAEKLPVTANDISGKVAGAITMGVGMAQMHANNPYGIATLARGILSPKYSTQRSGDFSGNAGMLGNRAAYLIITRPQTMLADNFPAYQGKPTNYTTTVGACKGFIKCKVDHIENVSATDTELNEIDVLLQQGILV